MPGFSDSVRKVLLSASAEAQFTRASILGRLVDAGILSAAWHKQIIRPDDLLVLDIRFANLKRDGAVIRRIKAGQALLIVEHQTQSLADGAYPNVQDSFANKADLQGHKRVSPPAPPFDPVPHSIGLPETPVPIRAAGPSRLVFEMPSGEETLLYTLDGLLDACRRWPLHLDASAQPEPISDAPFGLSWVARDLTETVKATKEALGKGLSTHFVRGLESAAQELAKQTLEGAQAGQPPSAQQLDMEANRAIAGLLANQPEMAGDDARSAASLYLRASSAQHAVQGLLRSGKGLDSLASLSPGFYGALLAPHQPSLNETAIEMPWRLIGSPLKTSGFAHVTQPVEHGGRIELWHSRLGERHEAADGTVTVDDLASQKLRYLWSPDYRPPTPVGQGPIFSLTGSDREMIVKLTAGFDEQTQARKRFIPRPVDAKRLILSSLGGVLDCEKHWALELDGVDMTGWTHRASQGRDSYVRVEYAGFLYPFGHAATLVKISERMFEWRGEETKKDRVAALRQRYFIVVREKIRAYPRAAPQPFDGRQMPFETIECLVGTTPDLAEPGMAADQKLDDAFYSSPDLVRTAYWPARSATELYQFPMAGVDSAGRRVPFSTPLMFVSWMLNNSGTIDKIRDYYNAPASPDLHSGKNFERRQMAMNGAIIRFAPIDPPTPGAPSPGTDVDLPTMTLRVRSHDPSWGIQANRMALQQQPVIEEATVKLAAVERLTGTSLAPVVKFDGTYLEDGFTLASPGEIFLTMPTPAPLEFGGGAKTDSVGGLAAPSMIPAGLSRLHGVASASGPTGLSSLASGTFEPVHYFPSAKLLNIFDLKALLKSVALGTDGAPVLTTTETPLAYVTRFRLVQDVGESTITPAAVAGVGGTSLLTGAGGDTKLTLTSTITRAKDGASAPTAEVEGSLTNFKVNLVGVIIIHFDRLRFLKTGGRKPDVDVDMNPDTAVTFGGPLEFVNTLREYIPANAFSDPPDLQVTAAGITAGFSLALPAIQCGILSLSNVSLGAAFTLPFNGDAPTVRFNFAERHNTFNLTVSLFGGGGFVAIVVGTNGLREIEAALEFGAQIAINLGVASGSVYVKGGFYFHYVLAPLEGVEFEGYVEIGGSLCVLGLITVSLTFHLSLTYESKKLENKPDGSPHSVSRLFGQATLVVEIEILFFSTSVSVMVEKSFIGSEADPLFVDFIPTQMVWDEYCSAFA